MTINYHTDVRTTDRKTVGNLSLKFSSFVGFTDFSYVVIAQSAKRMVCFAKHHLSPSFAMAIQGIDFVISKEQMIPTITWRIVAVVKNAFSFWDTTIKIFPCLAMTGKIPFICRKVSIATHLGIWPLKAFISTGKRSFQGIKEIILPRVFMLLATTTNNSPRYKITAGDRCMFPAFTATVPTYSTMAIACSAKYAKIAERFFSQIDKFRHGVLLCQ